ncbi:MAG: hypothetical protein RR704_03095 [Stenotrophomonas sp.]
MLSPATALALAAGIMLAGCSPAPQAAPAAPATPTPDAAAALATATPAAPAVQGTATAAACPHPAFDSFLQHFGREIILQEASTADPLLDSHVDADAQPEPVTVVRKVPLADVEWPVMPNPSSLPGQGREMSVTRLPDGQMEVLMRTPNSSDQQRYTFAQAPCWQLVRRDDESI